MSEKTRRKGSAAPGPVPEGLIRIYSMRFCPYAQRTRIVLAAKGIKFEIININLRSKPEWFLDKDASGEVPVLETSKGDIISESTTISDYLDEAYPGKKLTPSDPLKKAQQKVLLKQFSKLSPLMYNILFATKRKEDVSGFREQFNTKILEFEEVLVRQKSPYFGGDSVSMIDYMIWPFFERAEAFCFQDGLKNTPKINSWIELMMQDPAVKATKMDAKIMKAFFALYATDNSPDVLDFDL
ncbi:glutathione S-transferase omega-1-like [Lissotriton helveticus]